MDSLISKIKETIFQYGMIPSAAGKRDQKTQKWLIAVSGGPDSVALWRLLTELKKSLPLELGVVHLNHGLRGRESDAESEWIEQETQRARTPYFYRKADTKEIAQQKKWGLEETARYLRYTFFEETAKAFQADAVATGHNLDDQAETVFMRMMRGAGMDGLGGIPPVNQRGSLKIVRPLIEATRSEITAYLKKNNYLFHIDSSNNDPAFTRNFVRHDLLARVEKEWNPSVKKILSRSARQHREVFEYIEEEAQKWWGRTVRFSGKSARIKGGILKKASPFMRQEVVKRVLRRLSPESSERFNFEHFTQTAALLSGKPENRKMALPDGIMAEKTGKDLVISIGVKEGVC